MSGVNPERSSVAPTWREPEPPANQVQHAESSVGGLGDAQASAVANNGPGETFDLLDMLLAGPTPVANSSTGTISGPISHEQFADRWLRYAASDMVAGPDTDLPPSEKRAIAKDRLGYVIAAIDGLVTDQLNAVLHHPRFQALESSWRGLHRLAVQMDAERSAPLQLKMLSLSRRQWSNDLLNSTSFDDSFLFRQVYEEEYGMPGGKPYGILVNDFEIGRNPGDWDVVEALAGVAAASFCPMVLSASPSLLGLDHWGELPFSSQLTAGFSSPQFVRWNRFRKSDDAKYIALTLPRTLMREPYDGRETTGFVFSEDTSDPLGQGYLWGSASYAFASVVIRSFADSRWLADIRGAERGVLGGGLVTDLPKHEFGTDRRGVAVKTSVEVIMTDPQEAELSQLGFLPLSHCMGTEFAAFFSSLSLQEPKQYTESLATANAKIGSMLQYTLCVSRFAHYLKVIARDWVGSSKEAVELQRYLDRWIKQYVADSSGLSNKIRAERPLRKGEITVNTHPTRPGTYLCTIDLWPHYQVDQLSAAVQLKTTIISNTIR